MVGTERVRNTVAQFMGSLWHGFERAGRAVSHATCAFDRYLAAIYRLVVTMVCLVYFDVGETLVSEARMWALWAEHLGVSAVELATVLEESVAKGQHHHTALRHFSPDLVIETEQKRMAQRNGRYVIQRCDLYPDAIDCLVRLRDLGIRIGVAGNQPLEAEKDLRALGLPFEIIASSAGLGVAKPSAAFFEALQCLAGVDVEHIAYVGDRMDNDVLPAQAAGMTGIFLERGPWGRAHAKSVAVRQANMVIQSLTELPDALAGTCSRSEPV